MGLLFPFLFHPVQADLELLILLSPPPRAEITSVCLHTFVVSTTSILQQTEKEKLG